MEILNFLLLSIMLSFLGNGYALPGENLEIDFSQEYRKFHDAYQTLLDRIESLENKIEGHPVELDALRQEFKTEINQLHQSYAREISDLKEGYRAEVTTLREKCERQHTPVKTLDTKVPEKVTLDDDKAELDETSAESEPVYSANLDKRGRIVSNMKDSESIRDNRIRQVEGEVSVAFFATLSTNVAHLGQNQNVKFDTVVTNVGNAYDQHLGVFRAPVAGIYVFSTTMVTDNDNNSHFGLYRNSTRLTILWLHGDENGWDGSSNTIVVQLNQNDDISVRQLDSDKAIYGSQHCMFSGFLLTQNTAQLAIVG